MAMDPLDQKLTRVFAGKVVRKDLLHQLKGGENVPSDLGGYGTSAMTAEVGTVP